MCFTKISFCANTRLLCYYLLSLLKPISIMHYFGTFVNCILLALLFFVGFFLVSLFIRTLLLFCCCLHLSARFSHESWERFTPIFLAKVKENCNQIAMFSFLKKWHQKLMLSDTSMFLKLIQWTYYIKSVANISVNLISVRMLWFSS